MHQKCSKKNLVGKVFATVLLTFLSKLFQNERTLNQYNYNQSLLSKGVE